MNDSPNDPRLEALRRRWEADPTPQAAVELAEAYRRADRPGQGAEILEAAVEKQPARLAPQVALGRYLAQVGRRADAVAWLERVVETDPTHLVANKLLVGLHLDGGELKQARDRLDLYSLLNASDPEIEQLEARLAAPPATPAAEEPPPLPPHVAAPRAEAPEPEATEAEAPRAPAPAAEEPPPLPPLGPASGAAAVARSRQPTEMLPRNRLTAPLGQGPEVAPPREDLYGGSSSLLEPVEPWRSAEPPVEEPPAPPAADSVLDELSAAAPEPLEAFEAELPELDAFAPAPDLSDVEIAPASPAADLGDLAAAGGELAVDSVPEVQFPDTGLEPLEAGVPEIAEPVFEPEPEPEPEPAPEELFDGAAPEPSEAAVAPGDEPTDEIPIAPSSPEAWEELPEEPPEAPAVEAQPFGLEALDLDVPMPATPELETPALATEPEPEELLGDEAPEAAAPESEATPEEPAAAAASPETPLEDAVTPPAAEPFVLEPVEVEPPDLPSLPPPLPRSRGPRAEGLAGPPPEPSLRPPATRGSVVFGVADEEPFHVEWTEGEKARAEQSFAQQGPFGAAAGATGAMLAGGLAAAARVEPEPSAPPEALPARDVGAPDAAADAAAVEPAFPAEPPAPSHEVGATVTLARLYQRQGHLEEARAAYREVLARHPGNQEARRGLAEIEGAPARLTAAELLAGADPALGRERKKVLLLESYLRRLRGSSEGRPA